MPRKTRGIERRPPSGNPKDALKAVLVRLTLRTREQLQSFARRDERSQSLVVERALMFYFKHNQPDDMHGLEARLDRISVQRVAEC